MSDDGPEIREFPCAQCGAALRYAPGADALVCDHCGHRQPIPRLRGALAADAVPELDYAAALASDLETTEVEETRVVHCTSCGASVEFDPEIHADRCAFCAAPIVTDTGAHRHFKPKGVLPFLVSERDARERLKRWLEGLWFAPGDLGAYARASRPLSGLYLPYWTFDADTRSRYDGERGDIHHVDTWTTVIKDGKPRRVKRRVQTIRWTRVSGRVARFFDDVMVAASRSLPPRFADRLGHGAWDLAGLEPYSADYLAGFRAEAYSVDVEEGFSAARAIMDMTIRRDARFDIGGDRQRVHRIETEVDAVTFKHILAPVWIAAYRYRGESYRFVVNGRTGETIGERPYSPWKIVFAIGMAALAAAAAVALYALYAPQG